MRCDHEDTEAPRDQCGCRECYRARERALDSRLIDMAYSPAFGQPLRRSGGIIHQTVRQYLAGTFDMPTMYIELVRRLAADSDAVFDRELAGVMLREIPHFILDAPKG